MVVLPGTRLGDSLTVTLLVCSQAQQRRPTPGAACAWWATCWCPHWGRGCRRPGPRRRPGRRRRGCAR